MAFTIGGVGDGFGAFAVAEPDFNAQVVDCALVVIY